MPENVTILISGGGSNMVALVKAMQARNFGARPALVLSNNPEATGLVKAASLGVKTASVDHRPFGNDRTAFEEQLEILLGENGTSIICLAGFMRILTAEFMRRWQGRVLNIHPSLLPKYPGLNTHQRALDAGDKEAGCTVHLATEELDCGPILGQRRVPVLQNDTAESLAARVLKEEHILYPDALEKFTIQRQNA